MNARWHIDRLLAPCAGQNGSLPIVDAEDGPTGRVVCIIPGYLEWQATPDCLVRLLDEQDVENARLIAAAPELRTVLAGLIEWAARTGGWEAPCWREADAVLSSCETRAPRADAPSTTVAGPVRRVGGIPLLPDGDRHDHAHHAGAACAAARQRCRLWH